MLLNKGEHNMYKPIIIVVAMLLFATATWADDYIYDEPYGGKKIGRIDEKGFVYDKSYRGKKLEE